MSTIELSPAEKAAFDRLVAQYVLANPGLPPEVVRQGVLRAVTSWTEKELRRVLNGDSTITEPRGILHADTREWT